MATKIALLAPESIPIPDLHATMAVRVAAGRAARKRAPWSGMGDWDETSRGHDPLTTVLAQSESRLPRSCRCGTTACRCHRGTTTRGAGRSYGADLVSRPNSGLEVQLCGDAHVLNFGLWATPERNLNFDLRDFDETLPGPFEWDPRGLAASLVVVARGERSEACPGRCRRTSGVDAYRRRMYRYAESYELDIWYDGMRVDRFVQHFEHADRGQVKIFIEKGKKKKTSLGAYPKLTAIASGRPRITPGFPIRCHLARRRTARNVVDTLLEGYRYTLREDRRALLTALPSMSFDRSSESAASAWVVYLVLLQGRSGAPLFLQCKQASASVYEAHLRPAAQVNHGERVIAGKRMVKSATDIFEGWGASGPRGLRCPPIPGHEAHRRPPRSSPTHPIRDGLWHDARPRPHARSGDSMAIDSTWVRATRSPRRWSPLRLSLCRSERAGPCAARLGHRQLVSVRVFGSDAGRRSSTTVGSAVGGEPRVDGVCSRGEHRAARRFRSGGLRRSLQRARRDKTKTPAAARRVCVRTKAQV